ncbi:MAG: hypothetical protein O7C59_01540 [Rickettsia endosymbiont of Ixodes persulcatus]|nr:hypothetical protein [Rickettsia endosymbiont of Ixodes persulcatus]
MVFFCRFFLKHTLTKNKKKHSVVFIGDCYYSFYYLAEALQKRGWDALSVATRPHFIHESQFIYDNHLNLYDPQKKNWIKNLISFYKKIAKNYGMVHFYGRLNYWPTYFSVFYSDIKLLKKLGTKIGYSPTGCRDGVLQTEVYKITGGLCNKCILKKNPIACSDKRNKRKVNAIGNMCDLLSYEMDWPTPHLRTSSIGFPLPMTFTLSSKVWHPLIQVPLEHKIARKSPAHIIILSAFGNEYSRSEDARDIKGIKFIRQAINQLVSEGYPIQPMHANNIASKDMKYIQVQADIIVDQLNYGSIGAAAREGMMLGKPVICHISQKIRLMNPAMKDCPAIDATEESIYEVLKKLILSQKEKWEEIGQQSRMWMLKWFDADICAERFEKVYDRLMQNLAPYSQDLLPQ